MASKSNVKFFDKIFDLHDGDFSVSRIEKLKKPTFTEIFDENKLIFLINNFDQIPVRAKLTESNETMLKKLEDKRNVVKQFFKSSKHGRIDVKYSQTDKCKDLHGRYFGLGGQGLMREIRNSIYDDHYVDIDLKNCHPNIISWMCRNFKIEATCLNQYINNRENIINDLIAENPNLDKSFFKSTFLSLNNGGMSAFKLIKNKTEFLVSYEKEIKTIRSKIIEKFFAVHKRVKQYQASKNKSFNIDGKTIAHICTFVENQVILEVLKYLRKNMQSDAIQQSILCFDGIMIRKHLCEDLNDHLTAIHSVFKKFDFSEMILEVKPFEPLDLISMGYDPGFTYSIKEDKVNDSSAEIVETDDFNTFDESDYYFSDLCAELDGIVFNHTENNTEGVNFLKERLHKVYALVQSSNCIVKENKDEYFKVCNRKNFSEQLIHFIEPDKKGNPIKKISKLFDFININKVHFKQFNHIRSDFWFDCTNRGAFIACRQYAARYNPDYKNNESLAVLLKFIKTNIFSNNDEMFNYELDKLAIMCKYPHKKTCIITLLFSKQGCGKNMYTDFLCNYLIGYYNSISNCPGIETVTDDKNAIIFGKKLIIINEMSSTKDKFMSNYNKMKALTTESWTKMRFMYSDSFMCNLSTEYYALSNHKNSYIIENKDSRREFVPDIDESYADDRSYFGPIRRTIENQECGNAFYSFLMNRDITYDEFMQIKVPCSKTKLECVEAFKPSIIIFAEEFEMQMNQDSEIIKLKDLYGRYKLWLDETGSRSVGNYRVAARILKEYKYEQTKITTKIDKGLSAFVFYKKN